MTLDIVNSIYNWEKRKTTNISEFVNLIAFRLLNLFGCVYL